MKKRNKVKNKKSLKKIKVFFIIFLLIVIGIVVFLLYQNKNYLNNASKNGCEKGYYFYNIFFSSGCKECPKGQYCPGDNKYYSCDRVSKQLTTASTRSKSSSDCNRCKDESKYYKNGKCETCPEGYYCRGGTLNECAQGKTTKGTGKKNYNDCVCKAGTYLSGSQCKKCPICNGYQTCFTTSVGATSINQCKGTVPAGKYINCNASSCTVKTCEGNTYSKSKNVNFKDKLSTSCTECPKGKVANVKHTECVDLVCPNGQYKKDGKCVNCPTVNGTTSWFTSPQGSTSITQCFVTVPSGRNLKCDSTKCTSETCPGNTYSNAKTYNFKSGLTVNCKSCGKKKVTWDHTRCK